MATRETTGNKEATGAKKEEKKKEEQSQNHAQTQQHAHKQQTSHKKNHEGAAQRQTYQLVHRGESNAAAQAAATVVAVTGSANPHTPACKSAGRPPPLRVSGAGTSGRLVPHRYGFKFPLQGGTAPGMGAGRRDSGSGGGRGSAAASWFPRAQRQTRRLRKQRRRPQPRQGARPPRHPPARERATPTALAGRRRWCFPRAGRG